MRSQNNFARTGATLFQVILLLVTCAQLGVCSQPESPPATKITITPDGTPGGSPTVTATKPATAPPSPGQVGAAEQQAMTKQEQPPAAPQGAPSPTESTRVTGPVCSLPQISSVLIDGKVIIPWTGAETKKKDPAENAPLETHPVNGTAHFNSVTEDVITVDFYQTGNESFFCTVLCAIDSFSPPTATCTHKSCSTKTTPAFTITSARMQMFFKVRPDNAATCEITSYRYTEVGQDGNGGYAWISNGELKGI